MTDREAMKLALEAFEYIEHNYMSLPAPATKAITALREALANEALDRMAENARELGLDYDVKSDHRLMDMPAQQEPVAWLHTKIEGVAVPHRPADLDKHPDRWEALYKTPPPCPTCEALARTVMLDQTYHDNISPQRTWVGLTDEEIDLLVSDKDGLPNSHLEFARAIEAKLKEKNT